MCRKLLMGRFGALAALVAVGLCMTAMALFSSLLSSETSKAAMPKVAIPKVTIPKLAPQSFAFVPNPRATAQWPSQLLMLRQANGELFVWTIPLKNGEIMLPDKHWWLAQYRCPSFAPNFSSGMFECAEPSLNKWGKDHLHWRLDGSSVDGSVEDMERITGVERSGEFVFGMR